MGSMIALLLAALKLGKIGGTLITMLISLAAYGALYGWRFALGFILLMFAHEMGHFLAARQRKLAVGAPTFIPFVGAWIELKEQPMDVETEAYVAMAGPFVGTIAATSVYLWGSHVGSPLLIAVAYSGFLLNFFNLIPLSPLDGGRITAILSPRIWFLGVPVMLAMMFYRPSPLLVLIAIAALPQLKKAWNHDPRDPEIAGYYKASGSVRAEYGLLYLGLAAFLCVMTYSVHDRLGG